MNYAKLDKSERLQRADAFLSDGQWHSTRDIVRGADVCAVNAVIPELELNGIVIERKRENGNYYYRKVTAQRAA